MWPTQRTATRSCFRTSGAKVLEIFVFMIRQFHRNESSWNVRSQGTNVPRNESSWNLRSRGTKVPRSECSIERKFHGSESSLYGLFAPGNESAEERKGLEWVILNTAKDHKGPQRSSETPQRTAKDPRNIAKGPQRTTKDRKGAPKHRRTQETL